MQGDSSGSQFRVLMSPGEVNSCQNEVKSPLTLPATILFIVAYPSLDEPWTCIRKDYTCIEF